jgi:hypothetical protein
MTEIVRERTRVVPVIRKLVSRRMPQHVRMHREGKLSGFAGALDHSQEQRSCCLLLSKDVAITLAGAVL